MSSTTSDHGLTKKICAVWSLQTKCFIVSCQSPAYLGLPRGHSICSQSLTGTHARTEGRTVRRPSGGQVIINLPYDAACVLRCQGVRLIAHLTQWHLHWMVCRWLFKRAKRYNHLLCDFCDATMLEDKDHVESGTADVTVPPLLPSLLAACALSSVLSLDVEHDQGKPVALTDD